VQEVRGLGGTGPTDVFAVGDGGAIAHYDGVSWRPMVSGTGHNLSAVCGTAPGDAFAVGKAGTMLWWDGEAWKPLRTPTSVNLTGVSCTTGSVFVVGVGTAFSLLR